MQCAGKRQISQLKARFVGGVLVNEIGKSCLGQVAESWTFRLRILDVPAMRSGCRFQNGGMMVNVLFLKEQD